MRLEARDISFKYGKGTRQILDHVNLTVEPGESVGIMAPSGYGKTTLCKILAGYLWTGCRFLSFVATARCRWYGSIRNSR